MEANVKHLHDANHQAQYGSCIMLVREHDYHIHRSRKEPPTVGREAWLHVVAVSTPRRSSARTLVSRGSPCCHLCYSVLRIEIYLACH